MSGKKWNDNEDSILIELYKNNESVKNISNKLNRTVASIRNRITALELNKKYKEYRKENIVGEKYGKLTIIEDLGIYRKEGCKEKHHYVKCQCDCENKTVIEVEISNLRNGHTTSCGCDRKPHTNFKDLTGNVYGHLTVIKRVDDHITPKGTKKVRYLCRCDCPEHNEVIVWASNLKHGNKTLSCGCHKTKIAIEHGYNTKLFNEFYVYDDIVFVKYTNCDQYFICDLEDWKELWMFTWNKSSEGEYATTVINNKTYMMHKVILDCCPEEYFIDHEYQVSNGVLDNRKSNLRLANARQNAMNHMISKNNTSGYIGVKRRKDSKNWEVTINEFSGKQSVYMGFSDKEKAIIKRLQLEHDNYGIFSPQRFLFKQYGIDDSDLDYESVRFCNKEIQDKYGYNAKSIPEELKEYRNIVLGRMSKETLEKNIKKLSLNNNNLEKFTT